MANRQGASEPLYSIRQLPALISVVTDLGVQLLNTATEIMAGIFLPLADLYFGGVFWTMAVFRDSTDLFLGLDWRAWMISIITSGIQISLWNTMGKTIGTIQGGGRLTRPESRQFVGLLIFYLPIAFADTFLDIAWVGVRMYDGFDARQVLVPDGDFGYKLAVIIVASLVSLSEPLTYFMVKRRAREHGALQRFSSWLGGLWEGFGGNGEEPRRSQGQGTRNTQRGQGQPAAPSIPTRTPWAGQRGRTLDPDDYPEE